MTKERYVELKSFEIEDGSDEWEAEFLARIDFLGHVKFSVSVPGTERDSDGNVVRRTPEDCMARAKRRMTLGLMLLADTALEQLSQEDQDNIVKALQSLKERDQNLHDDQSDTAQTSAE